MSFFSLPSVVTDYSLIESIKFEQKIVSEINPSINITLCSYINGAKKQIDSRQIEWERLKKYTNTYEYIHTHIPNTKQNVCKLTPLSRSFYKMIEICKTLRISDSIPIDKCKSFHFAEGPGGFIEALNYIRDNSHDCYYGMTLLDEGISNIPGWKKSQEFLEKTPQVSLWPGSSGDGDMMNAENLIDCHNHHKSSCEFVTGDGGFDFTMDFKHQEAVSLKLTFSQCAYAFACQKTGGTFVVKVFDTYTPASIDILYMLASVYEKIFVFKPHTSRQANSEKYIVCKNFKLKNTTELINAMYKIIKSYEENKYPHRFLNCEIPYNFICNLQEINAILGQSQLENISSTINIIDSCSIERLENLKRNHIGKCVTWCQKFKIPYNKIYPSSNIFMTPESEIYIDSDVQ